jgi:hypothetical protein
VASALVPLLVRVAADDSTDRDLFAQRFCLWWLLWHAVIRNS